MGKDKNPKLNPFGKSTLPCPICEIETVHIYIKPRLFVERDKDVDYYPRSVRWLKEGLGNLHPRFYYIRYCPKCFFAAGDEIFKNPVESSTISLEKFRKLYISSCLKDPKILKIMQFLAKGIDMKSIDFYQCFRLHLLAILQLQLCEPIATRDATDLGRYCLRLAWLYRDVNSDSNLRKQFSQRINNLLKSLKTVWPELPINEKKSLIMARDYYQVTLSNSYKVDTEVSEINLLYLIARINLKLGNIKEGHEVIALAKEKVRSFQAKIKEYMSLQAQKERAANSKVEQHQKQVNLDKTDEEIAEMAQAGRKLKTLADEMQTNFEDCKDKWQQRQFAICKKIIKSNSNASPEQLREILLNKDIDEAVVEKFCPVTPKKEKKGLFGFLNR